MNFIIARINERNRNTPLTNASARALLFLFSCVTLGCDEFSHSPRGGAHDIPFEIEFRSSADDFCDDYDEEEILIGLSERYPMRGGGLWIGAKSDGRVILELNRNDKSPDETHLWKVICHPLQHEFLLKNVEHGSYLAPPVAVDSPVVAETGTSPLDRFWWDIEHRSNDADWRIMATFRECNNVLGVRSDEDGEQPFVNSGSGMTTVFKIYGSTHQ